MTPDWFRSLLTAGTLALLTPSTRAAEAGLREAFDLRYWEGREPRHVLDVFAPKDAKGAPVVVFVHGGAWMFCDKDFFGFHRNVGRFLARSGYVAVLPNYRLSPKARHPDHVTDVARAFAWARRNAASYGGDPDRIVLVGHSAGGHLVTLLAADETYLKAAELKLTDADRAALRGVAGVSGVYEVPGSDELSRALLEWMAKQGGKPGSDLFEAIFGAGGEARKKASPLTFARKGMPPTLLLYGDADLPLLDLQAETFGRALKKAGAPVEVTKLKATDHFSIILRLGQKNDAAAKALLDFVARAAGEPARP